MRATIDIYDECKSKTLTLEAYISTHMTQKYSKDLVFAIGDCIDLSAIQCAVEACQPVSVTYGPYRAWAKEVLKYSTGNVDKLEVRATPFYGTGQLLALQGRLAHTQNVIPPNGGNADGIISEMTYNWLGGVATVGNLHFLYEQCDPKTYYLDSSFFIGGTTVANPSNIGGSHVSLPVNLPTSSSFMSYPITVPINVANMMRQPRLIYYSFVPPATGSSTLEFKLSVPTTGIQTPYHLAGNPISHNFAFPSPQTLAFQMRGAAVVYPVVMNVRLDFIGFYPTRGLRAVSPPINFGAGTIRYKRITNELTANKLGRDYATMGDVKFSPHGNTLLYLLGGSDSFGIGMPTTPYALSIKTLRAWRLPCERLP